MININEEGDMLDTYITIFAAWAALSAAAVSPGPNMVAVASHGLGSGRKAALTVAFGIALGGFGWALLTATGLGALFQRFPALLGFLGIAGGLYLSWLGYKGWRAALTGSASEIGPSQGNGFWRDTAFGFTVTATNPKVALLWGVSLDVCWRGNHIPVTIAFICDHVLADPVCDLWWLWFAFLGWAHPPPL